MTIQFNTDHNIPARKALREPLVSMIADELRRYKDHITRIEAHLTDVDGDKNGINDKRCVLEARIEKKRPVAVTNFASTHLLAVEGALDKLKSLLRKKLEKK
jgi:ribosome-associated translation inhibitor RaiA